MKSTDLLISQHKLILRALDVLDAVSARVEKTGSALERDVAAILDLLSWFADEHHQAKEETILFPVLRKAASQSRAVEYMSREHDRERGLIESLEKCLLLAKLSDFVACAAKLSSALRNHIYKEDHIL